MCQRGIWTPNRMSRKWTGRKLVPHTPSLWLRCWSFLRMRRSTRPSWCPLFFLRQLPRLPHLGLRRLLPVPLVRSVDDQLGTPRVRCDEHNGKFSLGYENKV
jgi:hypothetical protein